MIPGLREEYSTGMPGDLTNGPVLLPLQVRCTESQWQFANREILWCWKRDDGLLQRSIFFSGRLDRNEEGQAVLRHWNFFYQHRAPRADVEEMYALMDCSEVRLLIGKPAIRISPDGRMATVKLQSHSLDQSAQEIIGRLQALTPRTSLPAGSYPRPCSKDFILDEARPIVIYAGSGLSYEAGLPTLADIHKDFGVDDYQVGRLIFGSDDPLPAGLAQDPVALLARLTQFHVKAAGAAPSSSHGVIAGLYRSGFVRSVLTDNVDNLFSQCNFPFIRTRTVFPQQVSYEFEPTDKTLLVIGVAADRRQLIAQARRRGLQIVVVNPELAVSPFAQNLSYLTQDDKWYKMTAAAFFETYLANNVAALKARASGA